MSEARVFEDFEEAYLNWTRDNSRRYLFQVGETFVLAPTENMARRAWMKENGPEVEKLGRDKLQEMVAEALEKRLEQRKALV